MIYTFTASEDLEQLNVVKLTGELSVGKATENTDTIIGVVLQSVKSGENVPVQLINEVLHGYAGATITAGDKLTVDTHGNVIPETTSGNPYFFVAITDAAIDEEVQFIPVKGTV